MPYVSVDEAQNATLFETAEALREFGLTRQRALLVASDGLRVVLLVLRPGEEPHRPHRHPREDEVMLVMQGGGMFTVGSEPGFVAGSGSLVYVPRGVLHGIQAMGPEPLALLSIVAPNEDAPDEAVEEG